MNNKIFREKLKRHKRFGFRLRVREMFNKPKKTQVFLLMEV